MEAACSVSSARTASAARPVDPGVAAACALFERYERPVLSYCLRCLRSRDEAEDAVQSTFLRAFTALQRGFVPDVEAAWLFKIAHNVCLSQRLAATRRSGREVLRDFDGAAEPAAKQADADELFGLSDALSTMPPRLRTSLLLREWQGLSYKEIASALGTTESAVTTLIFRARRHLAQALAGETAARDESLAVAA
jgi:RNA polymerase sigma factor (sigma-70 family)